MRRYPAPVRIAYVCPRYAPLIGGVETHVARLAAHLGALGCEIEVLTQHRRPSSCAQEDQGVVVRRFRTPSTGQRYVVSPMLLRELRSDGNRFDVVHAHDYAIPAVGAALATGGTLVLTPHYHGPGPATAKRLAHLAFRPLGSLALRRAARVICVSEAERALVAGDFPHARDRLVVVPNGTSVAPCPESSLEPKRILVVGRLTAYKRVDVVLRCLAELPDDVRLDVVGDGPARDELTKLAAELGILERTTFAGQISDEQLGRHLCRARALVTMSSQEAFGLAPLDALAAGLRVVASDIPAHRELAEQFAGDRMTLVALEASPNAVAAAIERALADRSRVQPDGLPTWERVAETTLGVYRTAMRAAGVEAAAG